MKNYSRLLLITCCLICVACSPSQNTISKTTQEQRQTYEAWGNDWVAATQGKVATETIAQVYANGGNIVDAAVAASYVLAVERPQSTGLGGGGFLLYREAKTGKIYVLDFRERAPMLARQDMYLDQQGHVIANKSVYGNYAAGVPGMVKGLTVLQHRFGKLSYSSLLQPAITLAEQGFPVYSDLNRALVRQQNILAQFPASKAIFLHANNDPLDTGELLVQKDLAQSLREIAISNGTVFYQGDIATKISQATDGWISKQDLQHYQVKWRKPLYGNFHGMTIVSMPPPSSGGAHIIEILNILENFNLKNLPILSSTTIHMEASAMQMAFVDRARYMADTDFTNVPIAKLTSKTYAQTLSHKINLQQALSAEQVAHMMPVLPEHTETTHFSIMDRAGNVVVSTQTINGYFGSGKVIPNTGILLNNEMDDFATKPGALNIFGAVGGAANLVAPQKTPLSSMSPTMVLNQQGQPILALGAPGGTSIITCVTQVLVNKLVFQLPLYDAIATARFHEQWLPDELILEPAISAATKQQLSQLGYKVKTGKVNCYVIAVARDHNKLHSVTDPRGYGMALGK